MKTFASESEKKLSGPTAPEPDPKVLAQAITEISASFKRLLNSGLNRDGIIALIQDDTGLPKRTISFVLNSLTNLANRYTTLGVK